MSPTFLEVTVALIAAVLVFMFAIRAVPLVIQELARYFDKTLDVADGDEGEPEEHER
jgi:hypothetical protein